RYVGLSLVGLGVSVTVVSAGHPLAWLRQTRGAGSFQGWYYGSAPSTKLYYLKDLQLDAAFWLCLLLAVGFAVWLFRAKKTADALSAAAGFALTLGMCLWNLLYCLLSASPAGPAGGAQALLAALAPALAVRLLLAGWHRLKKAPGVAPVAAEKPSRPRHPAGWAVPACGLVACAALVAGGAGQLSARANGRGADYRYVAPLGGWLGEQAAKLETETAIAAGKTVWSTYASALEAMTGTFQPAGTDYIIHVLGDRQRLNYLQQFQAGGFDLVQTPSYKVNPFERWSRNANWWFYRELYRYWQPVGTTYACGGMHIFWERTGQDGALDTGAAVTVTQDSPATATLTVTAADPSFCGVADVQVSYQAAVASGFALRGGVGSFLQAEALTEKQLCEAAGRESTTCDFYIPADRTTYDVPITIENGVGVLRLNALPADAASVQVAGATITALYTDWEYFYE
ncbi:MAG: hypothetical protein PHO10_11310, partial [Gemmiger sp.]|nr:hypothetical protein [Gemmiger sp.]